MYADLLSYIKLIFFHFLHKILFRAAYAMLIAARLPKGTDVSFITEMIEVIIFYFNLPFIKYIYKISRGFINGLTPDRLTGCEDDFAHLF